MPIQYKFDILSKLKEAGYSTYKLRKEKLLGEATIQKLRNGELVSWENISTICELLGCQPGDLIKYLPDWVENKILELTEKEEERLNILFEGEWVNEYGEKIEEKMGIQYSEEYLPEIIEKLEYDEEIDPDYIDALKKICLGFPRSLNSPTEIEEQYPEYSQSIIDFFSPYLEEYNEELEKEHQEYIDEKVKEALKEEKAEIEKQAFEEYFSDSEEE